MSKVSSSSQSKIPPQLPSKSAWARGPPQSTSSAPSPRTQSPAPSSATPPATATHSRRPSALTGQGVSIKDGVSVPRSSASAVKQGSSVTFGSIDDASSAPISSSPASIPAIKAETVKSFGTVPASPSTTQANGKSPVGSVRTAANGSSGATHASKPISKADISKLFQNPSSNSSSPAVSSPPPTSSPSVRPSSLPQQTPPQGPQHPPSQPSQLGAGSYTPFTPSAQFRTPTTPANGPGQPPRSPVSFRPMTNGAGGAGARPSTGPTSPPGPPQAMPAAMPSPRMTPHPHPGTPAGLPPGTPVGWQPYYYSYMPGLPPEHYMPPYSPHGQWHMPPQGFPPQQHHPQSHLSHAPPGPPGPPHIMPMSPRNPPPPLQGPGTPTPAHALPAQHQPPSSSASSISSPPATPASLGPGPPTGNARLNTGASAFVPRQSKVVIKAADGKEVDLQELRKQQAQAGGPVAPPSPAPSPRRNIVRMETEEAKNKRLAEEREKERLKKEEERRKKEEAEEKERKEREEEERKKREEEKVRQEEAQKKKEEEARIRKEAEEEKERIRKEEEEKERLKREEEERIRKDEEEKERIKKEEERVRLEEEERMRKAEEEERLRKEEEEKMRKEEAAKAEPQPAEEANPQEPEMEDGEVKEDAPAAQESKEPKDSKAKEPLRIDTALSSPDVKRRPGPLDLSGARQATIPQPLPSALATARIIEDLGSVTYPEGIQSPKPELNANAKGGKFRYDRDFLLQFMSICKEKPDHLPPLDAIGLEPVGPDHYMTRGGSGRGNRSSSMGTPPLMRQASVGLGISNFGKPGGFAMGQFATPSSKLSSEERFAMANSGRGGAAGASAFGGRPPSMSRTPSQGGPGSGSGRTRSHRGNKRPEKNAGGPGGSSMSSFQHMQQNMGPPLEPVAPLQSTANRWTPNSLTRKPVNEDSPEIVDRKVRGLLNKLTMERFESISNQIIDWANKSEKEKDGRTLIQVIRLVFEKATDEAAWSEMYARLCRKMMEQISPNVQDEGIRNPEGKPITGGQLFRKYLLNRCQEDFERGWAAKEASAAAAKGKASEDAATAAANEGKEGDEAALYSEEYYAAQKAKRQGLGLVKFIGELFKLQMLTERIMHECIKKLLSNVDNPEEEEIESLCQLLTTIGQILDTPRAKQYMDIYFTRMKELAKNPKVSSRMQFMLQDVIELRERKWIPRNALAAPTTIAQVHQQAARDHAVAERESAQKMNNMSRGGSRRGQDRGEQQQADGWTAARPAKAGDLSNFGKISKPATMTFGPSGVFAGKNKESKRDSTISRSASGNMFSMLENAEAAQAAAKPSRPPSRKPSVDLSQTGPPTEQPQQRRRLQLLPRSKPIPGEDAKDETPSASRAGSDDEEDGADAGPSMSEEEAKRRIGEDLQEFFAIRDLDEAEQYFTKLPQEHWFRLVDALVTKAIEAKQADAELVAGLFSRAAEKGLCTPAAFEEGFMHTAEFIDDIAVDAPKALDLLALMMKGAGLDKDEERRDRIVNKSMDKDKLISLLSS